MEYGRACHWAVGVQCGRRGRRRGRRRWEEGGEEKVEVRERGHVKRRKYRGNDH
jgi:hypothetical protein